ncbi:hypothetical protein KRP22_009429 [Phytophthora ramorum]|nr:hypothetical protein KRP22_8262 [Phytophthora ramorum]
MASSYILLFPEDMPQETAHLPDVPLYGVVTNSDLASDASDLNMTLSSRASVSVPLAVVARRAMPADEANGAGAGELPRRPVVTRRQDKFRYDQVVDYDYDHVVVCVSSSDVRTLIVPKDNISEVTPAICALLGRAGLSATNYDDDRLAEMHDVILDQLLGANQSKATRRIGALLSDIIDPDQLPTGEPVVRWV